MSELTLTESKARIGVLNQGEDETTTICSIDRMQPSLIVIDQMRDGDNQTIKFSKDLLMKAIMMIDMKLIDG